MGSTCCPWASSYRNMLTFDINKRPAASFNKKKNTILHGLKGCDMAVCCIILGDRSLHIMYYKNPELSYKLFLIITKMKSIQLINKQCKSFEVD